MNLLPRIRLSLPLVRWRAPLAVVGTRRARVVVLFGLALVVAVQLAVAVAVDTVRPEWRDPEYGHRLHRVQLWRCERPDRPLVLAIGSSRTQMGFCPAAMGFPDASGSPLVFNFGQTAAGPLQLLLNFLRVLDNDVRPDFVLIELFPAVLGKMDGPAEEQLQGWWSPRLGAGDLRRLEPYCRDQSVLRRQWIESRLSPIFSFRLAMMSHALPRWLPFESRRDYQWSFDEYGWQAYPFEQVSDERREKGTDLARRSYRNAVADPSYHVTAMADRSLRDIVARARRERIPIAFYLTPEGPEFRSWYTPHTRATVAAYREVLTRELGVPVFDVGDDFAEDEFADSHHMLRRGAMHFSRRLAADLRAWMGR